MLSNKKYQPVSALKKWLLIAACLAVGLLLGLFIAGSARNDLDVAWEGTVEMEPIIIEYDASQVTPPGACTCVKEVR